MAERFVIHDMGTPLLKFEYEVHIKDQLKLDNTIIIKSGYPDKEPTLEYANKVLTILNNGNSTK